MLTCAHHASQATVHGHHTQPGFAQNVVLLPKYGHFAQAPLFAGRHVVDCGMGTKQQPSSLLSKVARYFREPEPTHAEASESVQARNAETEKEKHALQSLIERKRQDDLVRRREFNHLRKLRTHSWGSSTPGLVSSAMAFQHSSGFNVEDRASTIKKIDAIEATMVEGWSKSKAASRKPLVQPAAAPTQPNPRATGPAPGVRPPKLTERAEAPSQQEALDDLDLDFTQVLSTPTPPSPPPGPQASPKPPGKPAAPPPANATKPGARQDLPTEPAPLPAAPAVRNLTPPPELVDEVLLAEPIENGLQAAAMLFAEGDSAAAEAVLLSLIQGPDIGADAADVLASALFDLYRATGQQDGFDVVAMDYAGRFGRSPAEWFSLPDLLKAATAPTAAIAPQPVPLMLQREDTAWVCPPMLDAAGISALRSRFSGAGIDWHVDWAQLTTIAQDAAKPLSELMTFWATHPVKLHWSEVSALQRALERNTPADDNTADPLWWLIRLDLLCILGEQDTFESLALDYCVVYEVSPPSWKDLPCEFMQEASASTFASASIFAPDADDPASVLPTDANDAAALYTHCELSGILLGDSPEVMERLQTASETSPHVVVSCARLIRIDFTATGDILNWITARQAEGCSIEFVNVPRLIAVFFKMLGIDGHAKITVRAN